MQQVNLQVKTLSSQAGMPILVSSLTPILHPIQFPTNVPGKAVKNGPSISACTTHVGDSDGISVSQIWPGPALASVAY